MKAKSIKGKSPEEIQTALVEALEDGYNPTLAFVFMSVDQDMDAICRILDKEGIVLYGATTAGEFTDQGIEKDSTAILLVDINPGAFELLYSELGDNKGFIKAKIIGQKGKNRFSNPGFIISGSGVTQDGKELTEGIIEASGTSTIIGGMAGDDGYIQTMVFSNNFSSDNGIVALVIDLDKIILAGSAISGWKPVGTQKTVTKADGNWILTIDNEPAVDLLVKFLGADIEPNSTDEEMRNMTITFPFEVFLPDGRSMMVPPLMFNYETKGILVPRECPEGTKLKFTMPPDFDVIDRVIQTALDSKKQNLENVDAMVIFSCIGRQLTLGPLVNDEIKGLDKVWDVPMAGFFCYGEFGTMPKNKAPDFVGTTCSWVALKEK